MFIKICGTTTLDDARLALEAGADAIGFVFAESKRQVSAAAVAAILSELPNDVLSVGVFRGQSMTEVVDIAGAAGVRGIQLHGHETPADVGLVRNATSFLVQAFTADDERLREIDAFDVDAILLDSPNPGSGMAFDWTQVEGLSQRARVILAGGLTPENIASAVKQVRPWGVDAASGVEATHGRKDADALRRFVAAARDALSEFSCDPGPA